MFSHKLSCVFIYYIFHIPFSFIYFLSLLYFVLSIYCIHVLFLYYFHISIFMYCSFPIFPYLIYYHITYLIPSCTFIYILILFIDDTFVCFNLVLFMYCIFICLLLISSLSSCIFMTYYILCTLPYIIYYPIPISSLLSCSGYTHMLCYSFLTYCFILNFLIRTCIVIYFHFILYCHIVLPYIFILYFSYTIISYYFHILCFSYTVLSYYLSYTILCH